MPESAHNTLALDIAFGPACACLIRRDGSIFYTTGSNDRAHSQTIMPQLQSILSEAELDWSELDVLAAGIGPGSFTGLRIAAATLAGINSSLNLPMLEISSLAIGAAQVDSDAPLFVIEDGRAGLAYYGHYHGVDELRPDACLTWKELGLLPAASYTAHQPNEHNLPGWNYKPPTRPRAQAMAQLVISRTCSQENVAAMPHFATPAYLIPSQAERNAQKH